MRKQKQKAIKKALSDSFKEIHNLVSTQADRDFNTQMSGSTLTVMLLGDDDFLYAASVGDSRAVLIQLDRKKKEILLSKEPDEDFEDEISQIVSLQVLTSDHNLNCIKEMKRV